MHQFHDRRRTDLDGFHDITWKAVTSKCHGLELYENESTLVSWMHHETYRSGDFRRWLLFQIKFKNVSTTQNIVVFWDMLVPFGTCTNVPVKGLLYSLVQRPMYTITWLYVQDHMTLHSSTEYTTINFVARVLDNNLDLNTFCPSSSTTPVNITFGLGPVDLRLVVCEIAAMESPVFFGDMGSVFTFTLLAGDTLVPCGYK